MKEEIIVFVPPHETGKNVMKDIQRNLFKNAMREPCEAVNVVKRLKIKVEITEDA